MKNEGRQQRIIISESETRKFGDSNFRKFEYGLECDLGDESWEDAFRNYHRVVQTALNDAINQAVPEKNVVI